MAALSAGNFSCSDDGGERAAPTRVTLGAGPALPDGATSLDRDIVDIAASAPEAKRRRS